MNADDPNSSLLERATRVIPGGVNSPVRAMRSVGGSPFFASRAKGATVFDANGDAYLDYIGSWGPLILGHADTKTVAAIQRAAEMGTSYGVATAREVEFAELICQLVPSVEMVRLVNSGTEACMSAIRAARGFTGRDKLVKVDGGYHGHADYLLVRAGSGAQLLSVPDSSGVPAGAAKDTLTVGYNDLPALETLLAKHGSDIAALIIEPVAGNMGTVGPLPGYLEGIRQLTATHGVLLIFDEVMTGFRLALGGAQERFGVKPDLTCMGKVIGGGLPVGAYGGRRDIMKQIAPEGPVYQAGTLSGNPLGVAAGLHTLETLRSSNPYPELERRSTLLADGLRDALDSNWSVNQVGSMLTVFACPGPVTDLTSAKTSDLKRFAHFHRAMRTQAILLPPSQFEAWFVSCAHTDADIERTIDAVKSASGSN